MSDPEIEHIQEARTFDEAFPDSNGPRSPYPGMVIDVDDVDSKLIKIKARGQAHFTGGDLDMISRHFGKEVNQLSGTEQMIALAYVYLRRAGVEGASWEMAANDCAVEMDQQMDPTGAVSSVISQPSVTTGDSHQGTSTG